MNQLAQPNAASGIRAWLTVRRLAQLALIVQQVIVIRTAGEYLRFKWTGGELSPALLNPLFTSLAALSVASVLSLILYFNGRERSVLVVTAVGIAALVVYKLMAMPGLG